MTAEFIQVSNDKGLRYLERFAFALPVNAYRKKRDASDAFLICIAYDANAANPRYRGPPTYIVRCMTGELLAEAEDIVRRKLGQAPRTDHGPSM